MRVGIDARKIRDFGIGTHIRGLLRGLLEIGGRDEYVALAPPGASIPEGIQHWIVDAPHYSLRELIVIGRAAERAGLDLLHAPHYVVPITSVPLTVTIHDLIHLHQPLANPLARLYARVMLRHAIRRARTVLTVTETVKHQLETELGARNVVVAPNGVQAVSFDRRPSATPLFLYAGNDKPHKNVETLVEAFEQVQRQIPEARLVLAGGTFERFARVADCRGFVDDASLSELYRTATAVVLPSLEEGFGLPAAEAMAHGTPVITTTAPALLEITGDAALHVDPHDAAALRDAMIRIARDAGLAAILGQRGRARAESMTWRRCAEIMRDAWREVVEGEARRAKRGR
jgi:alpha-1,3-rhamnosyl/mannosyltransferase